jgi:hypothetical protein
MVKHRQDMLSKVYLGYKMEYILRRPSAFHPTQELKDTQLLRLTPFPVGGKIMTIIQAGKFP